MAESADGLWRCCGGLPPACAGAPSAGLSRGILGRAKQPLGDQRVGAVALGHAKHGGRPEAPVHGRRDDHRQRLTAGGGGEQAPGIDKRHRLRLARTSLQPNRSQLVQPLSQTLIARPLVDLRVSR